MKGYDYNILLTCFYISYILFEFPANMMCKWVGPGWFIPTCSLCFGIASLGTAYVHNLGSACGVRFILGIFEAGMLPGIAYYLSRYVYLALRRSFGSPFQLVSPRRARFSAIAIRCDGASSRYYCCSPDVLALTLFLRCLWRASCLRNSQT